MDFDITKLSNLDRDRFSGYKSNLSFYNGSQWDKASKSRQLVFNYAKIAIDKVTSYLMNDLNFACEPIEIATSPVASRNDKEMGVIASGVKQSPSRSTASIAKQAEDLIYFVMDQNNADELDYTTEVDAAILGDGCYKVTWDALEKRVPDNRPRRQRTLRLVDR